MRYSRPIRWLLFLLPLLVQATLFPALAAPADTPMLPLEGNWRFRTDPDDQGEKQGWQRANGDDSAWKALRVPAGWEEQGITAAYPGMPGGDNDPSAYNGAAWYRLRVPVPAAWKGQDLELLLGRIDDLDRTYFNGTLVGELKEGAAVPSQVTRIYTVPQTCVRFGAENSIAVRVWDSGGPGGMREGPLALFPRGGLKRWLDGAAKGNSDTMELKERFANPPAHRRILKLIHQLPAEPQASEGLLLSLVAQGFGGLVTNVNFSGYLSKPENWQALETSVRRAREAGMTVWLYDEQGYPSASAGGLTLEGHPEWEARGLHVVDRSTEGTPVDLELPAGPVLSLAAYPLAGEALQTAGAIALAGQVGPDRHLRWTPPAGKWRVLGFVEGRLYEGTHAMKNLFSKRPYPNILMREPIARFLQLTHDAYAARFPKIAESFEATFTDEPSLMSVFMEAQPQPALPWSPDLPARFRAEHGFDLLPYLPALLADAGPDTGKVRCAFWQTVGKLVAENYFGQIQEWCRAHGVASSGHLLAEESLTSHVGYYGNAYECLRRMDYPGIDCLTSDPATVQWHIAKLIGSVADQIGAPKRMSETSDHSQRYRRAGDTRPPVPVSADQIRGTCNLLYLNGINTTTSYYSWNGLTTPEVRDINAYVGRLGLLLTGGAHRCDTAVFYPIESMWSHYIPAAQGTTRQPECLRIERCFRTVGDQLFQAARDFDYLDSGALRGARVEADALQVAGEQHRALVLPRVHTIPLDAWQKVAEFWRAGGIVIAVGATPANSPTEFPSREVQAITREIFGTEHPEQSDSALVKHTNDRGGTGIFLGALAEARLAEVLNRLLEPDFTAPTGSPLRAAHRRLEDRDFYLVINHSAAPAEQKVSFRAPGPAELWDPHTGEIRPAAGEQKEGRYQCTLSLRPYGALFVAFTQARAGQRQPAAAVEAVQPQLLAFGKATGVTPRFVSLSPGHVASEVTAAPAPDPAGHPALRITAQIKQGEQDCWCFPEMRFERPMDLSAYGGLYLRTRVPEGQQECGAELMVFVEQEGGALFLANAGRPLGGPAGWANSPLWFSALRRYGPTGPEGPFDPRRITAIRIGWGGYHARTGETVTFDLGEAELIQ